MDKIFALSGDSKDGGIISLTGDIDVMSVTSFKEIIIPIAESSTGDISIDCKELNYIDSTGLSVLVKALKVMRQKNLKLNLLNVNKNIKKLLKLTCLDHEFNVAI